MGSLAEWALAFALLALTLVGALSIGIYVAPFAIVAFVIVTRRNRDWPEAALGGSLGIGGMCLFIAYRDRGFLRPCPPSGTTITLSRGQHFSCGGWDPMPWLTVGLLLSAIGLAGYVVFRRSNGGSPTAQR